MNSPRPIEAATNPDLRHSWPALLRAAQRARQLAAQTGTAIVVVRDGAIEHIYPQPRDSAPAPTQAQEPAAPYRREP